MPASPNKDAGGFDVNLSELAVLLDISEVTLRKVIKRNTDFPVLEVGSNGVPYRFDASAVKDWWAAHQGQVAAERDARADELAQMRLEMFGGSVSDDQTAPFQMSGRQRKEEFEAQLKEIQYRRAIGELVEVAAVEGHLTEAIVDLRKELMRIPAAFAKRYALDRKQRLDLEARQIDALNRLADKLSHPQADAANAA